MKKMIDREKRSKTLSEVKPVKNISKNPQRNTLADGLTTSGSSMLDETESEIMHKDEEDH